jgi:hypothetical protein
METPTPSVLGPLMILLEELRGEVTELQGQLDAKRQDLMVVEATLARLHEQESGEGTSQGHEAIDGDVQRTQASPRHQYLEILLYGCEMMPLS